MLSNSNPVRWKIVAEEGAQIKNVMVGGYDLQDVQGTNAPIHYYVYHRFPADVPDSERTYFEASSPNQGPTYLSPAEKALVMALRPTAFPYVHMTRTLRDITGMEITSFQGLEVQQRNEKQFGGRAGFTVPP